MKKRDDIISRVNAGSKGGSSESQDADFTRSLPPRDLQELLTPHLLAKSLRALRNLQPKEGAKNVWRTRKAKVPGYRRPYDL